MGGEGTPRSDIPAKLFGAFVRLALVAGAISAALILWGILR